MESGSDSLQTARKLASELRQAFSLRSTHSIRRSTQACVQDAGRSSLWLKRALDPTMPVVFLDTDRVCRGGDGGHLSAFDFLVERVFASSEEIPLTPFVHAALGDAPSLFGAVVWVEQEGSALGAHLSTFDFLCERVFASSEGIHLTPFVQAALGEDAPTLCVAFVCAEQVRSALDASWGEACEPLR